jgi:hypothetical protein
VVALHFIVTREPATVPLPTARFAPDRPVRSRARALQFSELLLLLCRTGLVLGAGAALAQPVLTPRRRPLGRIVLADRSGSVANPAAVRDSVRTLLSPRDVLILFDSTAGLAPHGDDALAGWMPDRAGSLSAGLIVALRTAASLRDDADSLELVIVSAFAAEELDQATDSIRALWPGAIRLVRVPARLDTIPEPEVVLVGEADDPLRDALAPSPGTREAAVRIVRRPATSADSAWAGAGERVLVLWPAAEPGAGTDTIGAVIADRIVVVAPFVRARRETPVTGRVVARWLDGAPAAVEVVHGAGCIRTVDIPVPSTGDLVLDPRFQRLASRLAGPCGTRRRVTTLDPSRLARLSRSESGARVASAALAGPRRVRTPLAPWLLGAALLLGLGDVALRRRSARPALVRR